MINWIIKLLGGYTRQEMANEKMNAITAMANELADSQRQIAHLQIRLSQIEEAHMNLLMRNNNQ